MAKNLNLRNADRAKQDEFYTQLVDIEQELKYYKAAFFNKVVFCNSMIRMKAIFSNTSQ